MATRITSGPSLLLHNSLIGGGLNQSHSLHSIFGVCPSFFCNDDSFLCTFSCINGSAYCKSVMITFVAPRIPQPMPTRPPGIERIENVSICMHRDRPWARYFQDMLDTVSLLVPVCTSTTYLHPDPSSSTVLFRTNSGLFSKYLALEWSVESALANGSRDDTIIIHVR